MSILNKVAVCRPETLLKRDPDKGASSEFCKISKDTFFRTTPVDCFCLQSIEFKSAFCISNLFNADYERVGAGFPCQPEYWKTTNFVGKVVLIKEEKVFNSSFISVLFQSFLV